MDREALDNEILALIGPFVSIYIRIPDKISDFFQIGSVNHDTNEVNMEGLGSCEIPYLFERERNILYKGVESSP